MLILGHSFYRLHDNGTGSSWVCSFRQLFPDWLHVLYTCLATPRHELYKLPILQFLWRCLRLWHLLGGRFQAQLVHPRASWTLDRARACLLGPLPCVVCSLSPSVLSSLFLTHRCKSSLASITPLNVTLHRSWHARRHHVLNASKDSVSGPGLRLLHSSSMIMYNSIGMRFSFISHGTSMLGTRGNVGTDSTTWYSLSTVHLSFRCSSSA